MQIRTPSTFASTRIVYVLFMLLLFGSDPANAGQYVLDANQPTGSGSVTVTAAQNYSYHYSGYYPAPGPTTLTSLSFGAATAYGDITYSASETFSFHWEPAEGMTIEQDPPVEEAWQVTYQATINFGFPPQGYDQEGAGSASLTIDGSVYSGTAEAIPAVYDYMTLIEPRHENVTMDGDAEVTVSFLLEGPNPTVTIQASGHGAVDGEVELSMGLGRNNPAPGNEMITHASPIDHPQTTYPVNQPVDVHGKWKGLSGSQYEILQGLKVTSQGLTAYTNVAVFDTNPPTSDGSIHTWTGNDVTPTITGHPSSIVILRRKTGQSSIRVARSARYFTVVP